MHNAEGAEYFCSKLKQDALRNEFENYKQTKQLEEKWIAELNTIESLGQFLEERSIDEIQFVVTKALTFRDQASGEDLNEINEILKNSFQLLSVKYQGSSSRIDQYQAENFLLLSEQLLKNSSTNSNDQTNLGDPSNSNSSANFYQNPQKNIVRNDILRKAINNLTEPHLAINLKNVEYVYLKLSKLWFDRTGYFVPHCHFDEWKTKFFSNSQQKRENLKVLFLCDENPENDVKILVQNGILEENMYGLTLSKDVQINAIKNLKDNDISGVQIICDSIENYLEKNSTQPFDIIYFDACKPLPSFQKPYSLSGLTRILASKKLKSPGALITTFSAPPKEEKEKDEKGKDEKENEKENEGKGKKGNKEKEKEESERLTDLMKMYLSPFTIREEPLSTSSISSSGFDFFEENDELKEKIEKHFYDYYGTFITRQIIDTASAFSSWASWKKHLECKLLKHKNTKDHHNNWFKEISCQEMIITIQNEESITFPTIDGVIFVHFFFFLKRN